MAISNLYDLPKYMRDLSLQAGASNGKINTFFDHHISDLTWTPSSRGRLERASVSFNYEPSDDDYDRKMESAALSDMIRRLHQSVNDAVVGGVTIALDRLGYSMDGTVRHQIEYKRMGHPLSDVTVYQLVREGEKPVDLVRVTMERGGVSCEVLIRPEGKGTKDF